MGKAFSSESLTSCNKCRRKIHSPNQYYFLLGVGVGVGAGVFTALLFLHIHIATSIHQWQQPSSPNLRDGVTFLPLKDLRFASKPLDGHTWFMSSTLDTHAPGEVQFQHFPSNASKARILCLKGRDSHDGSRNSYALAWPHSLPRPARFLPGLSFVSYNHYDYDNVWHGLSAAVPFVAWHIRNNKCGAPPQRWLLYHRGELRSKMGAWLSKLMEAAFGEALRVEGFDDGPDIPACFERAVVMRHNEGGMSRERRLEVYDFLRCKARAFCGVAAEGKGAAVIGMTLLMRNGARSFHNQTAVVGIFAKACREVAGCRLTVAYANNLTFCQQVLNCIITCVS